MTDSLYIVLWNVRKNRLMPITENSTVFSFFYSSSYLHQYLRSICNLVYRTHSSLDRVSAKFFFFVCRLWEVEWNLCMEIILIHEIHNIHKLGRNIKSPSYGTRADMESSPLEFARYRVISFWQRDQIQKIQKIKKCDESSSWDGGLYLTAPYEILGQSFQKGLDMVYITYLISFIITAPFGISLMQLLISPHIHSTKYFNQYELFSYFNCQCHAFCKCKSKNSIVWKRTCSFTAYFRDVSKQNSHISFLESFDIFMNHSKRNSTAASHRLDGPLLPFRYHVKGYGGFCPKYL